MGKLYRYTVAGHSFAIEMPAELDEKMILKPYLPFRSMDPSFKVGQPENGGPSFKVGQPENGGPSFKVGQPENGGPSGLGDQSVKDCQSGADDLFCLKVSFAESSGKLPVGKLVRRFNDDPPYMWLFEAGQPNTAAVQINPLGQYVFGFSNYESHSDCYLFTSPDMKKAEVCLPASLFRIFVEASEEDRRVVTQLAGRGAAWLKKGEKDVPLIGGHHGNPLTTNPDGKDLSRMENVSPEGLSDSAQSLYGAQNYMEFVFTNCMMLLYTATSAPFDTLMTHSSLVRHEGKAYMFLGRSGTGKSTHSSLWLKYIAGAELMNDDNPIIRIVDGKPVVYGTPWSGKTPCYKNIEAPLGAIVRLTQAPHNKISRLNVLNSFAALLPSCSCMKWDHDSVNCVHRTLEKVIKTVPVYGLDCRPDEEAAKVCHDAVTVN